MKALSIRQPWAEMIIEKGKDVENRTWRTNYRGRMYVHASKTFDGDLEYYTGKKGSEVVLGAIIGSVEVYDCVRNSKSYWAYKDQWHWLLRNPRRYSKPYYCKGKQGLFYPDIQVGYPDETDRLLTRPFVK